MTTGPQRITVPTLQILAAFMADPAHGDWYGRALSQHTGLGCGTVFSALYRMEDWGWLESRHEDVEHAHREGRPPRRFYHMTERGRREAAAVLRERFSGELRFS